MGQSTDALLMYGYDLGDPEQWKIKGVGEYDSWEPDWLDESDGLIESAAVKLRAAAGFTETDWWAEGFFARRKEADARIGVEIVSHCSHEFRMYVLAAHEIRAWRGEPKFFDLSELSPLTVEADKRLASALKVLGFRPEQERPQWILASDWG